MVAMNVALALINLWHIRKLVAARHDEQSFEVLEVGPDDEYLRHVLRVHSADILKFQPDLVWDGAAHGRSAFLVQRGDETVGMVLLRDDGDGVARVQLDYVTPEVPRLLIRASSCGARATSCGAEASRGC